ncbi:nucleotide exchange factor GrpE [Lentzea sp.]|uniref:nucleotide exchange factor GrpE n=1 Tax=Lentzea sp. TaxID=56099 RepID=UPI002BE57CDE|nr:nucleotide exchange factor GrpE [Lentzea sp.]HUQ57562.1 nucleotide exchange factor GrpE [Lentzea sp.]
MTEPRHAAPDEEQPQVVVDDRRRIDPEMGEVRPPAHAADEEGAAPVSEEPVVAEVVDEVAAELKTQLDERTADLQRLTAEYANYRKRVERDREAVINNAKASVASELLSVLDDVERAAAHGDLTGAFKAVADKLVSTLAKTGLEPFAHEGEAFDPSVHEAVQHSTSPDVDGPTVTAVLRRGYTFGDKLVRPALVAVTDHEPAPSAAPTEEN